MFNHGEAGYERFCSEVRLSHQRCCDFCGRSESELLVHAAVGFAIITLDEDGLWVCQECRNRLILPAVGEEAEEILEELRALVGKSAGAICHTLNLPYEPPYQSVIDAASKIAYDEDRYMSAWLFVSQWHDGTIVWQSGDGSAIAVVSPEGSVSVRRRYS